MEYSGHFTSYVLHVFLLLPVAGIPVQNSGLASIHSGLISPPHPGFNSPGLYKSTTTPKVSLKQSVSHSFIISSKTVSSSIKSSPSTPMKTSTSTLSSTTSRSNLTYGPGTIISKVTSSVMASSGQSASTAMKARSSTTLSTTSNFNQTYVTGQLISGMTLPVTVSSGLPTAVSTTRSAMSNRSPNTDPLSATNSVSPSSGHLPTTEKHSFPHFPKYSIITSSHSTLNTAIGSSRLHSNNLRIQITNTGSADRLKAVVIATLVFTSSSIIIFLAAVYILRTRCFRFKRFKVAPETDHKV